MAKNFIQDGNVLNLTAPYVRIGGEGALIGSIFGVALSDVANAAEGVFQVVGVFDLSKVSAQAWTQGVKIYWDNTAKLCTTVSTANTLIGVAVDGTASSTATGNVRLNGSF